MKGKLVKKGTGKPTGMKVRSVVKKKAPYKRVKKHYA